MPPSSNVISLSEEIVSFEHFARLLDCKFDLLRQIHRVPPQYHSSLRRSIAAIDKRLSACKHYYQYLDQYARTRDKVG